MLNHRRFQELLKSLEYNDVAFYAEVAGPSQNVEQDCLVFSEAKFIPEFVDKIGLAFLVNIVSHPNDVNTRLHWIYQLINNMTILFTYC